MNAAALRFTVAVCVDGVGLNVMTKGKKRCHWCARFVGSKGRATYKEPNIFYCKICYEKGYQMECEAMYG